MKYRNLAGCEVEGEIWSAGPRDKTLWVLRPDGTGAVVNPTKGVEVEYEHPQLVPSPHPALREIAEHWEDVRKQLSPILGHLTPIGPDAPYVTATIKQIEESQSSRTPFIEAHGGRLPISDKRLRALAKDEIEE